MAVRVSYDVAWMLRELHCWGRALVPLPARLPHRKIQDTLRHDFTALDADGDGTISAGELQDAVHKAVLQVGGTDFGRLQSSRI